MKSWLIVLVLLLLPVWSYSAKRRGKPVKPTKPSVAAVTPAQPDSDAVEIVGQTAGPTPFIAQIQLSVTPPASLRTVRFTVTPKPGSVTRPVSATYTSEYLQSRGYLDTNTGGLTVPVFCLYADHTNTLTLTSTFADGSSQENVVAVSTPVFDDTAGCGYSAPTILQPRTNSTDLSYDYIMVKSSCGNQGPTIIDTDGEVRWVGTAGVAYGSCIFFENSFYISSIPTGSSAITGHTRIELDGTFSFIRDYANIGVTHFHHNYDPGKYGMLLDVDTNSRIESVILEVDPCGTVLKRWDLADIISAAITAGGEVPSQFVDPSHDWFHNNAVAYRKSDDSLIVSSRENFVIAIDYNSGAIKWILGDPMKHWHDFGSLRAFELTLGDDTLPPIGQHAVSITHDDDLLLFDDGKNSQFQTPAGADRSYSAPRKYHIDLQNRTATEVWNYTANESMYSAFCSSVYEDVPMNYLVDYANIGEILGLDAMGNKIFHYKYAPKGCGAAWNSVPIHLENLFFAGPDPVSDPRGWHITSVFRQGSDVVVQFPVRSGDTYRLEYKNSFADTSWSTLGNVTPQCSETALVTDHSAVGQPNRFYRVRFFSSAANLLANGDFETEPYRMRGNISGWVVEGFGHVANQGEGATSGTHGAVFSEGGDSDGNVLYQTFNTVAGQTYTLDFDAGVFGIRDGGPLQLRAQLNGSSSLIDQTVTPADTGTYDSSMVAFTHYYYTFTADSPTTTLTFTDVGLGNANADVVLDTVSVYPLAP